MTGRPKDPRTERRNSDQVPLSSYLLRVGTLLQITEHGREPFVAELTRRYSEVTGTFEVHPLGWPFPVVLHLDGVKDVRLPMRSAGTAGLSHAEYREVRRKQREAFERERRAAPEPEENEPAKGPLLTVTPRGCGDE